MGFDWDDIRYLLAVARSGTMLKAGEALGTSYTTVSRRIKKLEEKLNVLLLEQTPDGYILTDAAKEILPQIEEIEAGFQAIERQLSGKLDEIRGDLRITFSRSIGKMLILPYLKEFQDAYPDINLTVLASSQLAEMGARDADVALRVSKSPPDHLVGKRVGKMAYALYGAHDYLEKHKTLDDDVQLLLLTDDRMAAQAKAIQESHPSARIGTQLSGFTTLESAIESGTGLGILPFFIGDKNAKLKRLPFRLPDSDLYLWLLSHPDYRHSARIQAFKNFFFKKLEEIRPLIEGEVL